MKTIGNDRAQEAISSLIESILTQKRNAKSFGKVTLEVSVQDGVPSFLKVVDETTVKFGDLTKNNQN